MTYPTSITLTLVRGLPGSGKSSFAESISADSMVAADDFFMEDGEYCFDPSKLPQAHAWCLKEAQRHLWECDSGVVVHNTFTQRWEMEPYIQLAARIGVRLNVVSVFDGGCTDEELVERNSHGVPLEAIARMRERFVHDWKNDDVRPPWER